VFGATRSPTARLRAQAPNAVSEVSRYMSKAVQNENGGHPPWHAMDPASLASELETDPERGLSPQEAEKRLREHGPNTLREQKKASALSLFFEQFKDILIVILLCATVISALMGEMLDAVVIFVIVIACATLGFVQEFRAEKALEALKKMTALAATAVRGGEEVKVPAAELVPGDVVVLSAGDRVPADVRLVETHNLKIEEAALTGESEPTSKSAAAGVDPDAAVGDRRNMAYSATTVTYGRGVGVVVGTGMNTEFGRIAGMLQEVEAPTTPLEKRIAVVGKWLGILCLAIVTLVTAVQVLIRGKPMLDMLLWGISLAVAAVPEALPAVVTGSLAIGVQRMARANAIVRRLPAVETLGCTTVICSDKTGTLTKNEMTVTAAYTAGKLVEVTGTGYEPSGEFHIEGEAVDPASFPPLRALAEAAALCNDARLEEEDDAWKVRGDPTEGALVVLAEKAGIDVAGLRARRERVGEVPFEPERKCMSTVHAGPDGSQVVYVKGAPEIVLSRCTRALDERGTVPLDDERRDEARRHYERMGWNALRVLAVAYRELDAPPHPDEEWTADELERDLVFVGLVGMIDAPREEAKEAIEVCGDAGIRAVMVTGDHKITASAIAAEFGQVEAAAARDDSAAVITGRELDELDEDALRAKVEDIAVYARVSPAHKMKIIDAWQAAGHVVAMTGDGINDAPALKKADIGVAMGITGTDVTKEASDMTLLDDNFATIVRAIKEGRSIFENIKKYLTFLLSCNISEILICFVAAVANWPIPLIPIHLLWINLVTDGFPALALGVDPADPDIMKRPPRNPEEGVFTRPAVTLIAGIGIWIAAATLPLFYWYLVTGGPGGVADAAGHAAQIGMALDHYLLVKARTMCLLGLILFELFNAYNCRHETMSLGRVGWSKNGWLNLAVVASLMLAAVVMYVPALQAAFHVVPISLVDWAVAVSVSATVLLFVEVLKVGLRRAARCERSVILSPCKGREEQYE